MIEIIKDTKIDFMRAGRPLMGLSLLLLLGSVGVLLVRGLNLGIEFTGGTELQIKYAARPDVGAIRAALEAGGLTSQVVTTIGDPSENEVYIRLGAVPGAGDEDLTTRVARTLRDADGGSGRLDLNVADAASIARLLAGIPDVGAEPATALAQAIVAERREAAIFAGFDELQAIPGFTPEIGEFLRDTAEFGPFAVRSQSYVGPAVGRELVRKAAWAILLSLVVMLLYIWVRYQLQWGFAAVLAVAHDALITLAAFSLLWKEMSLPVVAAFLTLIGYSVNDTVVIFDRIRENLRNRVGGSLEETVNLSINQTLSRTIITSGLTWMSCLGLYLFGGPALNAFAFVLTFGIVIGSYSTICIASPFLVMWKRFLDRRARTTATAAAAPGGRPARKLRNPSSRRAG